MYFFFYSSIFIHFRSQHRPESYKYKKVDCDLCFALINHNSCSVFVLTHDAINNGGEFCCFLSEGDAKSDFNWFASVFYFILLSLLFIALFSTERTWKWTAWKWMTKKKTTLEVCVCVFKPPEEFSHSTHLKTPTLMIEISSCMDYLTFIRTEVFFISFGEWNFPPCPKKKDRKNVWEKKDLHFYLTHPCSYLLIE